MMLTNPIAQCNFSSTGPLRVLATSSRKTRCKKIFPAKSQASSKTQRACPHLSVPSHPFQVLPTSKGRWLDVSFAWRALAVTRSPSWRPSAATVENLWAPNGAKRRREAGLEGWCLVVFFRTRKPYIHIFGGRFQVCWVFYDSAAPHLSVQPQVDKQVVESLLMCFGNRFYDRHS